MKSDSRFPLFNGWGAGYYACSVSPEQKDTIIEYIKGQEAHHLGEPLDNEVMKLYRYAGIEYDDRDLR